MRFREQTKTVCRSPLSHAQSEILTDHYAGEMQIGPAITGHNGSIAYAQSADLAHLEIRVDDAGCILPPAHAAGAGCVLDIAGFMEHQVVKLGIRESRGLADRKRA